MKAEYDFSSGKFYIPPRTIILDLGSATQITRLKATEIIDKIKAIDSGKYKIIFKTQLWKEGNKNIHPDLIPLGHKDFDFIYRYCISHGYECTSSVFDQESLDFLKQYETPFIKIACRDWAYPLIDQIENALVSVDCFSDANRLYCRFGEIEILYCIPEYPASITKYKSMFGDIKGNIGVNISDHTEGIKLFTDHRPLIWEKHIVLSHDTEDPFGDSFCAVPEDFKGVL